MGLTVEEATKHLIALHPQAFDYGRDLHFEQAPEKWESHLQVVAAA
jgi:hypothetical protein